MPKSPNTIYNQVLESIKRPSIVLPDGGNDRQRLYLHMILASHLMGCEVLPIGGQDEWNKFVERTGFDMEKQGSSACMIRPSKFISIGGFGSVWVDCEIGRLHFSEKTNQWHIELFDSVVKNSIQQKGYFFD
jgi:hypothetical protein